MTQEQKQLLLADLCARLPYGVKVLFGKTGIVLQLTNISQDHCFPLNDSYILINKEYLIQWCKPYLRPMSSMTEEERKEYNAYHSHPDNIGDSPWFYVDWLNKNHFDYRGLIPMGLALPAKEGMYN